MGSLYLHNLTPEQRIGLEKRLWEIQNGLCFICGETIDFQLHKDSIDIDHVEPISVGGKDDPSNFALTHSSCNRSKQASDLRVARVLAKFDSLKEKCAKENRPANLHTVLTEFEGAKYDLKVKIENGMVKYTMPEVGKVGLFQSPLYTDDLSDLNYFFAKLPVEYLHHDDRINPRAIGGNLAKLVVEFHKKRPQLHVSLGWTETVKEESVCRIRIFDGQHKAAAQLLLGVRELPVRVFVNPDLEVLLATNTNAGTTLRQIAFDKSVQRHLGSSLFWDRVARYRKENNLPEDYEGFSERELVKHFKGESREMKRYVLDAIRDSITHDSNNRLKDYIDFGGRSKERPLSYSTIEKTFYSFFIYQDLLETPLNYRFDEGENPRELEIRQIIRLMSLIADEIFIGKFDPSLGTYRLENRIQKHEKIPEDHIRAHRMAREEVIYVWLGYVRQIIENYFILMGKPVDKKKLFQYKLPEGVWDRVGTFVHNLSQLPVWINYELSLSVFGGKQTYEYWQKIFETGNSPQGQKVLPEPLNLMKMIEEPSVVL